MNIPAIETRYAGCRFRSRLEARWAVFFDYVGLDWEYEPTWLQVRVMRETMNWLPDFKLGDGRWVEVKGDMNEAGAVRYISLAFFVGGCPGDDVVFLGPLPSPSTKLWPVCLHRCRGSLWACPWELESSCPLKRRGPHLPSSELDAGQLLAGLPWGQPEWALRALAVARGARF